MRGSLLQCSYVSLGSWVCKNSTASKIDRTNLSSDRKWSNDNIWARSILSDLRMTFSWFWSLGSFYTARVISRPSHPQDGSRRLKGKLRRCKEPRAYRKSNPDIFVMQSAEDRVAKIRPALFTVRDKGASLSRVPGRTRPFRRRRQGPPQRHPSLRPRIR